MKVLHIISGISRQCGGPSRSSQGLVAALCKAGVDAWIYPFDNADPWIPGVRKFTQTLSTQALKHFDLVHIHGIWDPRLHKVAVMCRKAGVPYVIAPRGMLEPWSLKQKWLKKRIARFLYQDHDLKFAAALHATAESEAEQFRRLGFKNRIIISPNGVNVPSSLPTPTPSTSTSNKARRALFVSRMHPKKGVLELVESWARVRPAGWCCELVYTMNGEEEGAYEQKVKDRILSLGMSYQDKDGAIHCTTTTSDYDFIFTGPLDDDAKWEAYARADLFVLPTYSENFGIVVAEALWAGVPVITTKGTPWAELVGGVVPNATQSHSNETSLCDDCGGLRISRPTGRCGWWVDLSELDSALREATSTSDLDLDQLGQNGRVLVESRYTWTAVTKAIVEGYNDILK